MSNRTEEAKALRDFANARPGGGTNWLKKTVKKLKKGERMFANLQTDQQSLITLLREFGHAEYARTTGGYSIEWVTSFMSTRPTSHLTYRIRPDYTIPDLTDETPPRFESGTPIVDTKNGYVLDVVDREEYPEAHGPFHKGDWFAMRDHHGVIEWDYTDNYQQLPPRHSLQEGWEYTGKAAKIDGSEKLAEGEYFVDLTGKTWLKPVTYTLHDRFSCWRHLARKKKEEPTQEKCKTCIHEKRRTSFTSGCEIDDSGNCGFEKKEEKPEPVEYVDYALVVGHTGRLRTLDLDGDDADFLWLTEASDHPRFVGYLWPDRKNSMLCRKFDPNGGPAEWPTHVRLAKS